MQRSEVWLINLDPTVGAEIRKIRPAVIVNDNDVGVLPLRVIVPLTDWKDRYKLAPCDPSPSNSLSKVSAADAFQVRSLSQERFIQQIGLLTTTQMSAVAKALATVLAIK